MLTTAALRWKSTRRVVALQLQVIYTRLRMIAEVLVTIIVRHSSWSKPLATLAAHPYCISEPHATPNKVTCVASSLRRLS